MQVEQEIRLLSLQFVNSNTDKYEKKYTCACKLRTRYALCVHGKELRDESKRFPAATAHFKASRIVVVIKSDIGFIIMPINLPLISPCSR